MYKTEQSLATGFKYFAFIAIFIACLGLIGIASYTVERKTKEIGIRKVLGASVSGIVTLLSREFLKWIVLANFLAWPIAWFFMNKWLQNFTYKINVGIPIFVFAALIVLVFALLTVSPTSAVKLFLS